MNVTETYGASDYAYFSQLLLYFYASALTPNSCVIDRNAVFPTSLYRLEKNIWIELVMVHQVISRIKFLAIKVGVLLSIRTKN